MRAAAILFAALLALAVWPGNAPADTGEAAVAVIMGPAYRNEIGHDELGRDELRAVFLQRRRFWDSGAKIQAVNLPPSNHVRRSFSLRVLGATPEELDEYWREQYFHGERPPYVFASEEAVLRFVAQTPGAIGYVSACAADRRVHVVWQSEPANCGH